MKRMSRFLSALLVLAMLCALVPAALADEITTEMKSGGKENNSVFVGDTFDLAMPKGCAEGHSRTLTFVTSAGKSVTGYITYSTSTGKYTAAKTTLSTSATNTTTPGDYVIAKVGCGEKTCTNYTGKKTNDYKFTIYSKASGIKTETNSVTLASSEPIEITAFVQSASNSTFVTSTAKQEMTCVDASGVVSATFNGESGKLTITPIIVGESYLVLTADAGTEHEKSTTLSVKVVENAVVSIKKDGKVVAQSSDTKTKSETVLVGATMTLTAEALALTNGSASVSWKSENPSIVSVSPTGAVKALAKGEGVICATIGSVVAKYQINVTEPVTSLKLTGGVDVDYANEEIGKGKSLTITAETLPADSAKYVVWTVSDEDVLSISANASYDKDTKSVMAEKLTIKGIAPGKATVIAKLLDKTAQMNIVVNESLEIKGYVDRSDYTIRDGENLVSRFQEKYPAVLGKLSTDTSKTVEVPVTWTNFEYSSDKKSATFYGNMNTVGEDGYTKYTFVGSKAVVAEATLTNEAMATNVTASASKTSAEVGEKITLTVKATADPAGATLSYQWYLDGALITGATGASYTYTVPSSGASTYKFYCQVTATKDGKSGPATTSNEVELRVLRDYEVEVSVDKTSCTVGQSPKATVTVYDCRGTTKKTVSSPNVSWTLIDTTTGKELSSNIATISGGTITTKATEKADGQKITVQATYKVGNDTYTGSKEITLSAAKAASITMSIGDGSTVKSTTINTKAAAAVNNSSITLSYVKFGTPKNCTLTKSASSSTAIGSTACYFSTTTGQKLSDVYAKLDKNATSGSVTYTVYDSSDNAVVTGTINFDSASSGNITCLGVDLGSAEAAELIAEEFPDAEYVKFDALDGKYGRLLLGYKSIVEIDEAKDVKDTDKLYLKNSSSVDGVEDLYLLPRTDYYGAITLSYTAYSSSNKSLGEGKLTFTVTRKTSSSKFTDVTASNVGSWAADAIDFMATNGLVGGVGNNKFNPTGTMTRCDLVLIMYRMAGEPSVTGVENIFTDVKSTDYFYKAVLWAYDNGVVNGTGANTFSPKSNITREQIASILYRYSGATTATGSISSFDDAAKVSGYATTAMKWAVGAGIIGGSNNKLDPQGNATRAQVAVMLHRFLNK